MTGETAWFLRHMRRGFVDAPMQRLVEMLRLEKRGDALERIVVDEDRAEQRLLGLDVERTLAAGAACLAFILISLRANHVSRARRLQAIRTAVSQLKLRRFASFRAAIRANRGVLFEVGM